MELKLDAAYLLNKQLKVLIVPYGIETKKEEAEIREAAVLIVPYGIETHISFPLSVCLQNVLIVPYGIET